jgi:hypothetical protein
VHLEYVGVYVKNYVGFRTISYVTSSINFLLRLVYFLGTEYYLAPNSWMDTQKDKQKEFKINLPSAKGVTAPTTNCTLS